MPVIVLAVGTVSPDFGAVTTGTGGNKVEAGTAGPVTDTATLCRIRVAPFWFRIRKSPPECSPPPKYAPVVLTVAVFQVLVPVRLNDPAPWYGSPLPSSYCTATVPVPWS